MNTLISIVKFVADNYQAIITGVVATLTGVISLCMLIPGDQPEKALQAIVDFLSKFSRKP